MDGSCQFSPRASVPRQIVREQTQRLTEWCAGWTGAPHVEIEMKSESKQKDPFCIAISYFAVYFSVLDMKVILLI